jgi:hypothetical protein
MFVKKKFRCFQVSTSDPKDANEGELNSYLSRVEQPLTTAEKGQLQSNSADIFQSRLPGVCNELHLSIVWLLECL